MSRLASLISGRLFLAWLPVGAVWLSYAIGLAIGGWHHDIGGRPVGADHVQYYTVGQLVNEGDAPGVYDPDKTAPRQNALGMEGYLSFRYPPFYALVFAPTSRLTYEGSFLVWSSVGAACLLLSGWILGVPWRPWLLWSLTFYPVFISFSFGQNSLISLFILSAAAALWLRDRMLLAGLVLGLLAFKPTLALGVGFLWIFDFRRSWPALVGIVLTTAALVLIGLLAVPDAWEPFFRTMQFTLLDQDRSGLAPLYTSQGFWLLLLSEHFDAVAYRLSQLTSVAGLVVFYLLLRRISQDTTDTTAAQRRAAAYGLAVLVTFWLTPYSMLYDWAILLAAAVLLKDWLPRDRYLVLCGVVWAAALAGFTVVRWEVWLTRRIFLPLAVHPAFPAIVFAVLGLWNPGRRAVEQPPHETPDEAPRTDGP